MISLQKMHVYDTLLNVINNIYVYTHVFWQCAWKYFIQPITFVFYFIIIFIEWLYMI